MMHTSISFYCPEDNVSVKEDILSLKPTQNVSCPHFNMCTIGSTFTSTWLDLGICEIRTIEALKRGKSSHWIGSCNKGQKRAGEDHALAATPTLGGEVGWAGGRGDGCVWWGGNWAELVRFWGLLLTGGLRFGYFYEFWGSVVELGEQGGVMTHPMTQLPTPVLQSNALLEIALHYTTMHLQNICWLEIHIYDALNL